MRSKIRSHFEKCEDDFGEFYWWILLMNFLTSKDSSKVIDIKKRKYGWVDWKEKLQTDFLKNNIVHFSVQMNVKFHLLII